MTCIVGLVDNGKLYMGADSFGANTSTEECGAFVWPKVFHNGPYLFGCTESFRMMQILQHGFDPPEPEWASLERFMAIDFSVAVRECFKKHGWLKKEDERERGGQYLVGVGARLFIAQGEFSFLEPMLGYAAVGSGWGPAMGSLFSTVGSDLSAEERVRLALAAAEKHTLHVRGPFIVEVQEAPRLQHEVIVKSTRAPDK